MKSHLLSGLIDCYFYNVVNRTVLNSISLFKNFFFTTCLLFSFNEFLFAAVEDDRNLNLPQQQLSSLNSNTALIWFNEQGPKPTATKLFSLAEDMGVSNKDSTLFAMTDNNSLSDLDRHYSQFLINMLNQTTVKGSNKKLLSLEQLHLASDRQQLPQLLASMLPEHKQVILLRERIRQYQQLEAYVWPSITQIHFRLGQRNTDIAKLRWMLTQLEDIPPKEPNGYRDAIYDPIISNGIKHFQLRHGLDASGKLDKQTLQALNVPPSQRITQMRQALFRWFELPAKLPPNYIWVNIPSYQLHVMEHETSVMSMRVIVGKPATPTPPMQTQLTLLTVNPTWTPPASIVYGELLPKQSLSPGYLASHDFELRKVSSSGSAVLPIGNMPRQQVASLLTEYRLVQQSGANNALGKYRFSIPNDEAIYLHDTPAKSLFSHSQRALSHGCVRLENARGLVNYLLDRHINQTSSVIDIALNRKHPKYFPLSKPLPVLMTYLTTWIDAKGVLQLRPDIYKLN
ncbi:L,D-transpeptidase family protein [Shewanella sp. 10N.286.52.C2]|uniref:L,D-transpeptidase family protein n=1 Tax=Shewanella sp. 10N.286.52.C2 TaxID=1880838 RepID=UPI000C837D9E|nr:L,D-transpeptidase family protein [Shewanella sp. 10N.286.52.C2]